MQVREFGTRRSGLVDGDLLAVAAQALEADHAVRLGEEGVVAAEADVDAGVDMGTPLTDQDAAREDMLPVGPLGPEALALGITAVLGGTDALLVGEELKTNVHHDRVPSFLKDVRPEAYSASRTSILLGYSMWSSLR